MLNLLQFRNYILNPTLKAIGKYSPVAEELLIGTGLIESGFRHIKQLGYELKGGNGIFQVETATGAWICKDYLTHPGRVELARKISKYLWPFAEYPIDITLLDEDDVKNLLTSDLRFSVILARLKYYSIPKALPSDPKNIEALAEYWKTYYNASPNGRPAKDFVSLYKEHVE